MTINKTFVLRTAEIRARVMKFIEALALDETHPLEVVVRTLKRPRSDSQNRRYWHIVGCIAMDTGNDRNTIHEHCKAKFLGVDRHEFRDKIYEIPRSSAELSTKEFAQYCEQVEAWAITEFGIVIDWQGGGTAIEGEYTRVGDHAQLTPPKRRLTHERHQPGARGTDRSDDARPQGAPAGVLPQ